MKVLTVSEMHRLFQYRVCLTKVNNTFSMFAYSAMYLFSVVVTKAVSGC